MRRKSDCLRWSAGRRWWRGETASRDSRSKGGPEGNISLHRVRNRSNQLRQRKVRRHRVGTGTALAWVWLAIPIGGIDKLARLQVQNRRCITGPVSMADDDVHELARLLGRGQHIARWNQPTHDHRHQRQSAKQRHKPGTCGSIPHHGGHDGPQERYARKCGTRPHVSAFFKDHFDCGRLAPASHEWSQLATAGGVRRIRTSLRFSWSRSSTLRNDSGNLMCTITTSWMISAEVLKSRNGDFVIFQGEMPLPYASRPFALTMPTW